ncbi:sugar efflux transporter [Mangrovihabitans endophyticus]|uniref:Sugar efflux transporter SetB n=1 Tax=Mangrovihabitans endophyticus TaxID=1751298 RepID=A0A8J3C1V1_9ACTN|nr:sugar efflux transporter [Mangrovihabitans endophyticus]GGK95190.1 sugar efflux transporter SetB [Mangrovihabitans endophyticus]
MAAQTPPRPSVGRALLPLGLIFLSVGMSVSIVMPFLALFLTTEVEAGPLQVTGLLIAAPLAGVVSSTLIGRISDRGAVRRRIIITAAAAGVIGTSLTSVIRSYWILLLLTVTATAVANALFPQTFAYARQVLQRNSPARAAMGISALRTVFSIAWVAGPPMAAVILEAGGFRLVYGTAAVFYALSLLVGVVWLRELGPPERPRPTGPTGSDAPDASWPVLLFTSIGFILLQTPLTLAVQALPLYVSRDLGGEVSDSGLVLGLCAALEIPLMLGFGALSTRVPARVLILAGGACGVAYYALASASHAVGMLLAAQIVNATFIAAVTGLGISYVQDMLPGRPGQATTLFTNAFPLGAMLAGPLFGLAQHFGFRLAFVLCTGLAAAGLALLVVTRPPARTAAQATRAGDMTSHQ